MVNMQYQSRTLFSALDRAVNQGRQLESELQRLQVEKRALSASLRVQHQAQLLGLQSVTPAITHYVSDNQATYVPDDEASNEELHKEP